MRLAITAVALIASCGASLASADVYMWTDAQGRVQYSDRPPKNFTGPVKRIDVEETTPPAPAVAPKAQPPKAAPAQTVPAAARPGSSEIADRRRAERERLQRNLDVARGKVAEARQALAEGRDLKDDERQIVQRPGGDGSGMPMPGVVPAASRANCRAETREGKKVITCPVSMPSEGYFDRVTKLEEAVKAAEADLVDAERAYRRGVD